MTLNLARTRNLLQSFDFETLFIEVLGWDYADRAALNIRVDETPMTLEIIAEKRGVVALRHTSAEALPAYALRRKIDRRVAKLFQEHIIIYTDEAQQHQIWQWVRRELGKPLASREHHYTTAQSGDALLQKLQAIAFSLEEELDLTLVEVTGRIRAAFDVKRATKKFYKRFNKERKAFQDFLTGVPDGEMESWYVSVMLNRLMFIYFIQKKGFLEGDDDYLRHKLDASKQQAPDRFYRDVLCPLFFQGFAKPPERRPAEVRARLGEIPYLNGGIFQRHEVEAHHGQAIQIPDAAFRRVFDFFDAYQWHLDDRPLRDDREINPDVLGYIFEKYINQKQMGAYYTQEDITGYISENTLLPFLLERARQSCPEAFAGADSVSVDSLWSLLAANPDRYIYDAVRKGCDLPLPDEIAAGVEDVSQREAWNQPTPDAYALPTEIWRETVARRQHYRQVYAKLAAGEITAINDLITYNLDSMQFVQDVIENTEDATLLRAFWRALNEVSVLDPTCGSGAFLFAALNILEPLYEACLERMAAFVRELPPDAHPHKFKDFREALAQVAQHPNRRYFVLKSIVINNLYGVDIMPEAVEIAKLRLFLKLVALVDHVDHIEPLPDIDFNIRAGNTLVGFATYDEVDEAVHQVGDQFKMIGVMEAEDPMVVIDQKAQDVDRLYQLFRQQQTALGGEVLPEDKAELRRRLDALNDELDRYLAKQYGVDADLPMDLHAWRTSHQPFHWFVEFYGVLKEGGFDVIIGNPPYVSVRSINYGILNQDTLKYSDIYGYVMERTVTITTTSGRFGMIIPLSITFSTYWGRLRTNLKNSGQIWLSSFDNIPAAIFSGVSQRCTIVLCDKSEQPGIFVAPMYRWRSEYRPYLIAKLKYSEIEGFNERSFGIPKLGSAKQYHALKKMTAVRGNKQIFSKKESHKIGFSQAARNFISVFVQDPPSIDASSLELVPPSKIGYVNLKDKQTVLIALVTLAGEFYLWYWLVRGDGFDVTKWVITDFLKCLRGIPGEVAELLSALGGLLHERRFEALVYKKNAGKYVGNFNYRDLFEITRRADLLLAYGLGFSRTEIMGILDYVQRVLSINVYAGEKGIPDAVKNKFPISPIDNEKQQDLFEQIDAVLKDYYGFTDEELDFILNYDIKPDDEDDEDA